MSTTPGTRRAPWFDTVAVPVASESDAVATCDALRPYLSAGTDVIVIHVIEKAGGGIDPAPVEQRKRRADRIFDWCSRELVDSAGTVETMVHFHTDVVEGILEATRDRHADVIAFTPRGANRFLKFISGDTAYKLVHRADCPVLVVPVPNRLEP